MAIGNVGEAAPGSSEGENASAAEHNTQDKASHQLRKSQDEKEEKAEPSTPSTSPSNDSHQDSVPSSVSASEQRLSSGTTDSALGFKSHGSIVSAVVSATTPVPRPPSILSSSLASNNSNTERSAVVMTVFGPSVGPCIGDFSTTYNRVNGRLYASTKAILFYSNLFGFERRLCLLLSEVTTIEIFRSTSIRISTIDCEEYIFKKFQNRDHVVSILLNILHGQNNNVNNQPNHLQKQQEQPHHHRHRESNTSRSNESKPPMTTTSTSQQSSDATTTTSKTKMEIASSRRPSLGERVGDLFREKVVANVGDLVGLGTGLPTAESGGDGGVESPRPRLASDSIETFGTPHHYLDEAADISLVSPRRRAMSVPMIETPKNEDLLMPSAMPMTGEQKQRGKQNAAASITGGVNPEQTSTVQTIATRPSLPIMKAAWDQISQPLEESHVEAVTLQCSLDSYFDLFFQDQAPYAVDRYQREEIGDFDIEVTQWKDGETTEKGTKQPIKVRTRKIQFMHPLKNALGPSKAKTTRLQRLHRFDYNLGICWENTTTVEGIPAADCFRIEDRWVFEPIPAINSDPSDSRNMATEMPQPSAIKLTVTFRIVFFKRTMLKSLIQKNVRQENRNWVHGYVAMVEKVLAKQSKAVVDEYSSVIPIPQEKLDATSEMQAAVEAVRTPATNQVLAATTYPTVSSSSNPTMDIFSGSNLVVFVLLATIAILILSYAVLQVLWMRQSIALWQNEMELLREQNKELVSAIKSLTQQQCQHSPIS